MKAVLSISSSRPKAPRATRSAVRSSISCSAVWMPDSFSRKWSVSRETCGDLASAACWVSRVRDRNV